MYQTKYITPPSFDNIIMNSDGVNLTGLWFEGSKDEIKHKKGIIKKDLPIFIETIKWLDLYFSGQIPNFIPKYKINNITPFRKRVIDIMNKIPYGNVVTYKDIASSIAHDMQIKKMSAQAVGGAVGANPICIIIPCHRVIGTNGKLVGYGGGVKNKQELLKLEGVLKDE